MTTTDLTVDLLDLGDRTLPKGTEVYVTATERDAAFTGTLHGVDHRDGVAYTAQVWDGNRFRQVYVTRVLDEKPSRRRSR